MKKFFLLFLLAGMILPGAYAQTHSCSLEFSGDSLSIKNFIIDREVLPVNINPKALLSFLLDGKRYYSSQPETYNDRFRIRLENYNSTDSDVTAIIQFTNTGKDTLVLENIVPFGEGVDRVYITGIGRNRLSRTHLFIPGKQPVNVIVPDNAWDLGFCAINNEAGKREVTALTRRINGSIENGKESRFETTLFPAGSVKYKLYIEAVAGDWHDALDLVFQKRMLYDIDKFDNSLFERKDLQWVRHAYVNTLMMNWDKSFYNYADKKFHIDEFLRRGKQLYGGNDFISLWPTWPTLGLDQRNQFDLFNDLPGGTAAIKKIAGDARKTGTRLFICYNPWDESTRTENHFTAITRLIAATSADGMVLDTKGESSKALQEAADKVRDGVIMYSEGMAVPKDMPGIVSGRVHNALYYPPMLNLNKLIKPEFAIFRVAELYKEPIQREFATAFFNGYGTELNIMVPGNPGWLEEQYKYLGRTSRILRENTFNFTARGFKPLVETSADSIWVNEWILPGKTVYTIYSIRPAGYSGYLFNITPDSNSHFVDIWHHHLLHPKQINGKWLIPAETNTFHQKYLGTNNEGEVDCIAKLPVLIEANRNGDLLQIATTGKADELRIWAGIPSYEKKALLLPPGKQSILLSEKFGDFEGDFIVQLMDHGILMDETIVSLTPGEPRRISVVKHTKPAINVPPGMAKIPGGTFHFKVSHGDEFIPYPKQDVDSVFNMSSFYMDKFPVTNAQFMRFIKASGYRPADTVNYLKHWTYGHIPSGTENFPVVYISYEDACAFAAWAGKRLPTEIEWQYAAQTPAGNEWPWKQATTIKRKEEVITATLTVSSIEGIDSSLCNLGNGKLYAVGKYPRGANPYGLQDLTGCVWQLTNDLYMTGNYRYIIMKGGSYFKPSSSWWYVQGGPRELHYRQYLLRVSQGFERNATVCFRCVKD